MKKLILVLALTTFATSHVFAQTSFTSIDVDQNGGISMDEAKAAGLPWTEDEFSAADEDGNGLLDQAEFAAATQ